jgi:hypothetical protein
MGPKISNNQVGDVIISAPFAKNSNGRWAGTIAKKLADNYKFWIADGLWASTSSSNIESDYDLTGSTFVQGKAVFY